jgi:SAM-dependent methyltransferase
MSGQIIGLAPGLAPSLDPWLQEGSGVYVRDWVQIKFDQAVTDIFGYHALQLGATSLNTFQSSRIAHRWCAADTCSDARASFYANASALPFFESSLDLVTLPFTLDLHSDPDAVLDEVARVLVPEGRVVIAGFHGASLWGLSNKLGSTFLPEGSHIFGYQALKSALNELGLVIEETRFGGYIPAVKTWDAVHRYAWLDKAGSRWWSSLGGMYFLIAKKRVMGVRPHRRMDLNFLTRARFGLPLHQPSLNKSDQSVDG